MQQRIVLDTNFLMIPGQFGTDIFEEMKTLDFSYTIHIVSGTLAELDKIIEKDKSKNKIAAKIGKGLVKAKTINIIDFPNENVDDALVELSKEPDVIVATQDAELKRRLHGKKLILRQGKYLRVVN